MGIDAAGVYTDAMVMGESVSAVIDILEGNQLYKVLCMGTTNPVSDFLRARHLRLRSCVLRERMKWGLRRDATFLAVASWKKFYSFMGMAKLESKISPQVVGAVVSVIAALGLVASSPKVAKWLR